MKETNRQALAERTRTVLRRRWVRVVLVVVVLLGGYGASFLAAHHLADSVSITVEHIISGELPPVTEQVYHATINDMAKARAIQFSLDHTALGRPETISCPASNPESGLYHFDFRFSFLGLTTQVARTYNFSCPFTMNLTTLGLAWPYGHAPPDAAAWRQIERVTGMPDFGAVGQQPG